jgi:hypothetical protein
MSNTVAHSPVVTYLRSGSTPLPVESLIDLQDSLSSSTDPNVSRKPSTLLIAAEACIDLAIQVEDSVPWIEEADVILDKLIDTTHAKRDIGSKKLFKKASQTLVNAYVRKAEIPNWKRAIDDKFVSDEYGFMLNAGKQISYIAQPEFDGVYGRAIEYVPLLLGSRAVYLKSSEQWFGRASLQREDASFDRDNDKNGNWDIGINLTNSGDDYVEPQIKLQVAARNKSGKYRYTNAGIHTILAKNYDFLDPNAVIAGCLEEVGISTTAKLEQKPFSTHRLDEISGKLFEKFVSLASGQ